MDKEEILKRIDEILATDDWSDKELNMLLELADNIRKEIYPRCHRCNKGYLIPDDLDEYYICDGCHRKIKQERIDPDDLINWNML